MKALFFDFDGTLVDTEKAHAAATRDGMELLGIAVRDHIPPHPFDECPGGNILDCVNALAKAPIQNEQQIEKLYQLADTFYDLQRYEKDMTPYPGIEELLRCARARGMKIAVISNSLQPMLEQLCSRFFPGLIDVIYGDHGGGSAKPNPIGILTALENLSLKPHEVVYVGDSLTDYQTAATAHIPMVGCVWCNSKGAHQLEDAHCCPIVRYPSELWKALDKINIQEEKDENSMCL